MINRLVLENLKHRPLRTLLSALSIGFQVMMILTIVGLSRGMLQDSQNRARGVNADIWVKAPDASMISFSSAGLKESLIEKFFRHQPHVARVTGTVVQPIGGINTISGIDLEEFSAISGGFKYLDGGAFQGPDEILIDSYYARQSGKKAGDTLHFVGNDWKVAGVVESGKLARLFVPLKRLQELTNNTGNLSQILIKLDDAKNTNDVIQSLRTELPTYKIYSVEELVSMFSVDNVPGLKAFIYVIIGLSIVVGFLVVTMTMYAAVLERTREIGIMKALGAHSFDVLGILVRETLMLAAVGWVLGIGLSYLSNWAINTFVHANLQSVIAHDWWPKVLGIALIAALLGAMYPGLRAAKQDAIEALAYE